MACHFSSLDPAASAREADPSLNKAIAAELVNTTLAANDTCIEATGIARAASDNTVLQKAGGLLKADVSVVVRHGRMTVCKDYQRWRRTPLAPLAHYLMRREARLLRRLNDWPHSPSFEGFANRYAFFMEYVPGADLKTAVASGQKVSFSKVVDAVAGLHRHDIVHNDIRGSNILVAEDGRIVIIDFASALYAPKGRPLHPLMRRMRRLDIAGTLKFKHRLTGKALTPVERRLKAKPQWFKGLQQGWKKKVLPVLRST
ncbi:protein kinase domain-containing protein [Phytohalomonas tamaricis]|uniref:protein kinase domain-containing protein n=1 Tax=Phytohalomonas tamaricis TaxID=2081032 RepID=UPI000D0B7634|nr:RIO1 family regulatory kinase/ATPase [Phytohalomonas tamaricis]